MLATVAVYIFAFAVFILLISALIFFHELGHYGVGRLFGISVDRFSIGFGKAIWSRRDKRGTLWTISRIPLGGFVKFTGDSGAASNPDVDTLAQIKSEQGDVTDIFHFKPVWQRALVVLAGPVANFLLAILLFAIALAWVGKPSAVPRIGNVVEASAAEAAGLRKGDLIKALDDRPIDNWLDVHAYISQRSDTTIRTTVERDGRNLSFDVTPRRVDDTDFVGGRMTRGQFGIQLDPNAEMRNLEYGPVRALAAGGAQVGNMLTDTGRLVGRISTGKESLKVLGSIGRIGAVTTKATADIVQAEAAPKAKTRALFITVLQIAASVSVALGFANLMPIPMLDGGHLMYYGYEAVAGKPLSQKKQEVGFRIGITVLLTLFIVLTINDIGYIASLSP